METGVTSLIEVGWLEPGRAEINLTWGSETFKNRNRPINVRTWNLSQHRKQKLGFADLNGSDVSGWKINCGKMVISVFVMK